MKVAGLLCFAAAFTGQLKVIETLIRLGSQAIDTPDEGGWTPLYRAAKSGRRNCVKLLKELAADSNIATDGLSVKMIERLHAKEDEDEVAKTRYRVYFAESLLHQLLFELSKDRQCVSSRRDQLE